MPSCVTKVVAIQSERGASTPRAGEKGAAVGQAFDGEISAQWQILRCTAVVADRSLQSAISRLGVINIRNLVFAIAVKYFS